MLKSKLMKVTTLGVCMSMLMAVPVFAGNGQGNQNTNMMPFMQNGQMMNMTPGAIQNSQMMNMTPGAIQNGQMMQTQTQNQQLSSAGQYMVDQGIIKGDSTGNYAMSNSVKRGDMSLMLMRAFNFSSSATTGSGFSDVSQSSYYYDAVKTMQSMGIAQGDGQNYRPGSYMTLEEAILFVERALGAAGIDYDEDDITSLFEGRSLSENATREDIAAILYAVLGDDAESLLSGEATTSDAIAYEADENTNINFDEDDFSDACSDATDGTLDYIVFSNPNTGLGRIYYGYSSSSDYDGKAAVGSEFYLDANSSDNEVDISGLTFVPNDDMHGTVVINYTGYGTDDESFSGSVKITINETEDTTADTITYSTDEDNEIAFAEEDFNDASNDATEADLSYVKFVLPNTSYGKLYYCYGTDDETSVSASKKYYYGSDGEDELALSELTFVPKENFTGTARVSYTGVNEDGETFTGTIKITVE
jgi:hypothetical protein